MRVLSNSQPRDSRLGPIVAGLKLRQVCLLHVASVDKVIYHLNIFQDINTGSYKGMRRFRAVITACQNCCQDEFEMVCERTRQC